MYIINFRRADSPVAEGWNPKNWRTANSSTCPTAGPWFLSIPPKHFWRSGRELPDGFFRFPKDLTKNKSKFGALHQWLFLVPLKGGRWHIWHIIPTKKRGNNSPQKSRPKKQPSPNGFLWISEPHATKGLSRTRFMTISTRSGVKQHHIPPSHDSSRSMWFGRGEIDFPHLVVAIFWKDFLFKIGNSYRTFILSLFLDGG